MSFTPTTHPASEPRKLKILMLHGYTQSGPLFYAKTRALEKSLHKAFPAAHFPSLPTPSTQSSSSSAIPSIQHLSNPKPKPPPLGALALYPGGVELIYPSGPHKLSPSQIPGYDATKAESASGPGGIEQRNGIDLRAWWTRNDRTGEYDGLEDGLEVIASAIRDAAPDGIDGVIGFSQGGAAAAFVASLLEPQRVEAFASSESPGSQSSSESHPDLKAEAKGVRYPPSFLSSSSSPRSSLQPPLKFFISYSGFLAPFSIYDAFYRPPISTPSLHFVGSLDTVVGEWRSLALAEKCVDVKTMYHPGGHFVPIGKDYVGALVGFIRASCSDDATRDIGELQKRRERGLDLNML